MADKEAVVTRKLIGIAGLAMLAGCGSAPTETMRTATDGEAAMSGEAAYRQYCATCHESGKDGAPVVGKHTDWADRSKLWQAVIMDHARAGYLDMPAKGGRPELPDATIDAAVEYMLELTHPEVPADR